MRPEACGLAITLFAFIWTLQSTLSMMTFKLETETYTQLQN